MTEQDQLLQALISKQTATSDEELETADNFVNEYFSQNPIAFILNLIQIALQNRDYTHTALTYIYAAIKRNNFFSQEDHLTGIFSQFCEMFVHLISESIDESSMSLIQTIAAMIAVNINQKDPENEAFQGLLLQLLQSDNPSFIQPVLSIIFEILLISDNFCNFSLEFLQSIIENESTPLQNKLDLYFAILARNNTEELTQFHEQFPSFLELATGLDPVQHEKLFQNLLIAAEKNPIFLALHIDEFFKFIHPFLLKSECIRKW